MTQLIEDLNAMLLVDRGRSAWSRSQTLSDALTKLQGEVAECIEAAEAGEVAALREELGDVLWSLLFALIVARDEQGYGIDEVASDAIAKFHHRKGWVLVPGDALSLEEEEARWLAVKAGHAHHD